ncbi:MAG: hypothetical protein C0424_02265 [Sphingobacteriaceae bacterium]|nr:hypothetical protein [Sphingobacteriaceae bacterium]
MKKLWLWLLAASSFLTSCSTDIDINAEWKETTLVLGVLNTSDSIHYLRIHKAFLDPEKSAFEVAQIKDSLYYNALNVVIEQIRNNAVVRTFNLEQIDTNLLQPGIFASPSMVLYRFRSGGILDSSSVYRLRINTPSNNLVTSLMEPIGNTTSLPNGLPPGGVLPPSFAGINWTNSFPTINFRVPRNAKMYELTVRVFYDEWNRFTVTPTDTPDLQLKFVDWKAQTNQLVGVVNNNESFQIRLNGRNMFAFMNSVIPVNPDLNRRLRGTLFYFDFADDNLNTFLAVNKPTLSVVDVRPTFTNIENGLGIFASRRTIPNLKAAETAPFYPFSSPYFREAFGGIGVDSLRIRYPQLNFVP